MAKLPRREVGRGDEAADCAVCITELAPGETARVLPRCGHAFHVDCVDMWLRSHSTCPLCRCPAVDDPPAVPTPVADRESPNFPTNVLFFGSQDEVSTGRSQSQQHTAPQEACAGLRRLIGCGGAPPPTQPCDCEQRRCRREEEDDDDDDDMREAFRVFDANGDGYITADELGAVLSSLGLRQGRTAEECRRMIGRVDRDGDGRVDFREFRQMMRAGGLATLG